MRKFLVLLILLLTLTGCSFTEKPTPTPDPTPTPPSEVQKEIRWKSMPEVNSYTEEELTFSNYGVIEYLEDGVVKEEVELNSSHFDLSNVNVNLDSMQSINVSYNNLTLPFNFTLKPITLDSISSVSFVKKLRYGINLGNTLENNNSGFDFNNDYTRSILKELGFSNQSLFCEVRNQTPEYRGITTANTVKAIKDAGFTTVRLPISWSNHIVNNEIEQNWINRVKEVVDLFYQEDMFVIVTLMEAKEFAGYALDDIYYDNTVKLIETVWSTVSDVFKDYDEHLIFENLNEPLSKENNLYWNLSPLTHQAKYIECNENLMKYNQIFVEVVRKAEGFNKTRFLTVNSYGNIPEYCFEENYNNVSKFMLPSDSAKDRILLNCHAYYSHNYAYGKKDEIFNMYNESKTKQLQNTFQGLKENYVDKGIGVIISEWGAVFGNQYGREQSREQYYYYYVREATKCGIATIVWDNTCPSSSTGEAFGLLNRHKAAGIYDNMESLSGIKYDNKTLWFYPNLIEQIKKGYEEIINK